MNKILISLFLISTFVNAQLKDCSICKTEDISSYLTGNETVEQLNLLKNEIYARNGYLFSKDRYKQHFSAQPWYVPLNDNSELKLNYIEQLNIRTLGQLVNKMQKNNYINPDSHIRSTNINTNPNPVENKINTPKTNQNTNVNNTSNVSRQDDNIVLLTDSKYLTLSKAEIEGIFNSKLKQSLGITFPIYKVYNYTDKIGIYYLVLTEKPSAYSNEDQVSVQVFNFRMENGSLKKLFEINDSIDPKETNDIHFYTRYILTEDIDKDGSVDPIIVYGDKSGAYCCSTTKIFVYHNGKRIDIKIKKSDIDSGREIQIDKNFYSLPKKIQTKVLDQMTFMNSHNHINFPYYYREIVEKNEPLKISG